LEHDISGICSTHRKIRNAYYILVARLEINSHLGELGTDGKILKKVLNIEDLEV
jgi:hypothetical protein